ncbi:MAG: DNA_ligase_IV_Ku-like, partial [uncultured Nocardioidaceae bacterium]
EARLRAARAPQAPAPFRPAPRAGRRAAVVGGAEGPADRRRKGPARCGGRRPRPRPSEVLRRRQGDRRYRLVGGRGLDRTAAAVHPARAVRVASVRSHPHRPGLAASPDQEPAGPM